MTQHSQGAVRNSLNDVIAWMDSTGFDIGKYHLSLFTAARAIIVAALVIIVAFIVARVARRLIRRIRGIDSAQRLLGEKVATIIVWTLAFFIGIDALNISLTAFTVFSGAFGLAIGFGLQKTFGNLIAGLILLMDRSIKPGDVIAIGTGKESTFGEVKKIGVRAVIVTTRDNREYLIPNEILMTSQVENWTYSSRMVSLSVPFHVTYASDLEAAEALLIKAATSVPRVLKQPPPAVLLKDFGSSFVEMMVSVWIIDPENGILGVRSQVLKAAWKLAQTNDRVHMAVPTATEIDLVSSPGLDRLAAALAQRGQTVLPPEDTAAPASE